MKTIGNVFITMSLIACAGLFAVSGCGSSGSGGGGGGTTNTLANAPTGYTFTDENGNAVTTITAGQTVQLRDESGNVLFAFTTDGDVDFSNVTADSSDTDTKAFVHFPADTDKTGITGTVTLYIPCLSNQNSIVVCPDATTLDEVTAACANAASLSPVTTTAGNYTYANAATRTGTTACQVTADIANFGTGGVGNVALPTLNDEDLQSTSPCPNQDLLTDPDFISALSTTEDDFRMYYDPASQDAACARGANFTGLQDINSVAFIANDSGSCSNWANLYANTNIGACGDDPATNSFPKAGVYRHDFLGVKDGTTYLYRVRATITAGDPDVMGQPYATVLGTEDIADLIEYVDPAGNAITQDCTIQAVAGSYIPYPMQSFTVRRSDNGETLFTVVVEIICAEEVTI